MKVTRVVGSYLIDSVWFWNILHIGVGESEPNVKLLLNSSPTLSTPFRGEKSNCAFCIQQVSGQLSLSQII